MRTPPMKNKLLRRGFAPLAESDRERHERRATARVMREKRRARATRKIERAGR
jgi:hypothetical protein